MKIWSITLPLLCAAHLALAEDKPPAQAPAQPEVAAVKDTAKPAKAMRHTRTKRLPQGDLRHCLELKDNEAIIRCSETGRKK